MLSMISNKSYGSSSSKIGIPNVMMNSLCFKSVFNRSKTLRERESGRARGRESEVKEEGKGSKNRGSKEEQGEIGNKQKM